MTRPTDGRTDGHTDGHPNGHRPRTLLEQLRTRKAGVIVLRASSVRGRREAAKELAAQLGLRLERVEAKALGSRYIGETEKNLTRLLEKSRESGVILFFDEADALFGKRTEVVDSHDRYANQEISYLILAVESSASLVIIGTDSDRIVPRSPAVLTVMDLDSRS
jgi:SpoVK/Ycf46/Vps4 family AAA+-type ATPase